MSFRPVITFLLAVAGVAFGQTAPKPAFEVASIKQSTPIDVQKLVAVAQAGGRMPIGARVNGARAEYTYMSLTQLITIAYNVKPYQITGPDWLATEHYDIVAKLPDGASKDDAPRMLQSLLEERFKLSLHRETKDQPVLALVMGKGGLKLTETEAAKPLDEDAPFKPGEMAMDNGDGPTRMYSDKKTGATSIDAGINGKYTVRVDQTTMVMHMEASQMTMSGFVDMLSSFAQIGNSGRRVVNMTGLKGSYNLTFNFSIADLMAMIRAQVDAAGAGSDSTPKGAGAASEPGGGSSLTEAVAALGLKLEPRKAPLEQLTIDHAEKTPIEN